MKKEEEEEEKHGLRPIMIDVLKQEKKTKTHEGCICTKERSGPDTA